MFKRPDEPERRLPTIAAAGLSGGTFGEDAPSFSPAARSYPAQAGLQGNPVLVVTEGPYTGKEFTLERLPASIGRGANAALRLDEDLGVSRQHAELFRQDGRLFIRDLNSTHGTLVNGLQIAEQALQPGDQIQIGYTRLLIRMAKERR
jgi:pSer/pThr/pTyr-binding forkhead associated (FHA) protein